MFDDWLAIIKTWTCWGRPRDQLKPCIKAIVYGVFPQRHLVTRKFLPIRKFMNHRGYIIYTFTVCNEPWASNPLRVASIQPNSSDLEGVLPLAVSPSGIMAISFGNDGCSSLNGKGRYWHIHTLDFFHRYHIWTGKISMFFQFHLC